MKCVVSSVWKLLYSAIPFPLYADVVALWLGAFTIG